MGLFSKLFRIEKKELPELIESNVVETVKQEETEVNEHAYEKEEAPKTKNVKIHSLVVGLKYEGRQAKLKKFIQDLKKDDYYEDKYDGLTNKEILEEIMFVTEENPIWELTDEYLPFATIKPEPENPYDPYAVAVYIGEDEESTFHIGYLLKNDAKRIQDLIHNSTLINVIAEIRGGKYKYIFEDEWGNEKVKIGNKDYSLFLVLYFEK